MGIYSLIVSDGSDGSDDDDDVADESARRLEMHRFLLPAFYERAQNSSRAGGSPLGIVRWEKYPSTNTTHGAQYLALNSPPASRREGGGRREEGEREG